MSNLATLAGSMLLTCAVGLSAAAEIPTTTTHNNIKVPMSGTAIRAAFGANDANTTSPIQHVIVIIGEDSSFDRLFATYVPKKSGETVNNLLSESIIALDVDGNAIPGANFQLARQSAGIDAGATDTFLLSPPQSNYPNDQLAATLVGGSKGSNIPDQCASVAPIDECESSLTLAEQSESGLDPAFYPSVSYLKSLADDYAMSDNFHQSVKSGTGANHIMLGHADMLWFSDENGFPATPPNAVQAYAGTPTTGVVADVESPNPVPGTNNWYIEDGYGGGRYGSAVSGGGSYVNCSDENQPGVQPVRNYLSSLPRPIDPHCEAGLFYLVNNYNPGYFGNGNNAYTDNNPANTPLTIPPSSTPSIGDDLNASQVSWKYYGDQWNNYVNDPYQLNYGTPGPTADEYCNICNPFQYDTSIMSDPIQVAAHIQDSVDLYSDIDNGTLPAVSFVKLGGHVDGHPSSSKLDLFEGFVKKIVDQVEASPYAASTAIFITFGEGGGYYDSGYVQPVDFFGDGTRVPLIVVSSYVRKGHIAHEYADHVSIDKFIERNWNLGSISYRSRDNLPNPVPSAGNPYVPSNSPALDDLFAMFDFTATPN
jgi:phospholipase C